eukprot:15443773-Alexandrium_andersonii.AAC.1
MTMNVPVALQAPARGSCYRDLPKALTSTARPLSFSPTPFWHVRLPAILQGYEIAAWHCALVVAS